MCLLCDDAAVGNHGIAVTERPAHSLRGLMWQGSDEEAAAGAIRGVIKAVKASSDARASPWRSPIVGISWNHQPGGLRTFVGVAFDDGEEVPAQFERLDLPEMRLASSWHGPEDGEVVSHYSRIIEWVRAEGLSWDRSQFHRREEYPSDVDLDRPPALRLLIPLGPDGSNGAPAPSPG